MNGGMDGWMDVIRWGFFLDFESSWVFWLNNGHMSVWHRKHDKSAENPHESTINTLIKDFKEHQGWAGGWWHGVQPSLSTRSRRKASSRASLPLQTPGCEPASPNLPPLTWTQETQSVHRTDMGMRVWRAADDRSLTPQPCQQSRKLFPTLLFSGQKNTHITVFAQAFTETGGCILSAQ